MAKESMASKITVNGGWDGFWIMVALTAIAFYGEPDIADGVVFQLTGKCPYYECD